MKDGKKFARKAAVLQIGGEWMCEKVALRLNAISVQGIAENGVKTTSSRGG
jgi:hypothetical protein